MITENDLYAIKFSKVIHFSDYNSLSENETMVEIERVLDEHLYVYNFTKYKNVVSNKNDDLKSLKTDEALETFERHNRIIPNFNEIMLYKLTEIYYREDFTIVPDIIIEGILNNIRRSLIRYRETLKNEPILGMASLLEAKYWFYSRNTHFTKFTLNKQQIQKAQRRQKQKIDNMIKAFKIKNNEME
jgi:hypothetical protein